MTGVLKRLVGKLGSRSRGSRGFTLLELLVVLAILGLLAAIIGPSVIGYLGRSQSQAASVQAKNIATALDLYRLDVGRYPTASEGLTALVRQPSSASLWNGPYLPDEATLSDPWGNPYQFRIPGEHRAVDVWSQGSDGAPGGDGEARDVGNW